MRYLSRSIKDAKKRFGKSESNFFALQDSRRVKDQGIAELRLFVNEIAVDLNRQAKQEKD